MPPYGMVKRWCNVHRAQLQILGAEPWHLRNHSFDCGAHAELTPTRPKPNPRYLQPDAPETQPALSSTWRAQNSTRLNPHALA